MRTDYIWSFFPGILAFQIRNTSHSFLNLMATKFSEWVVQNIVHFLLLILLRSFSKILVSIFQKTLFRFWLPWSLHEHLLSGKANSQMFVSFTVNSSSLWRRSFVVSRRFIPKTILLINFQLRSILALCKYAVR